MRTCKQHGPCHIHSDHVQVSPPSCEGFASTAIHGYYNHSSAFLIYAFIVFLLHLYSTSARNANSSPYTSNDIAPPGTAGVDVPIEYELASRESTDGPNKWRTPYARVPNAESGVRGNREVLHVVGDDDNEEDDEDRQTLVASTGARR